jgi:hypothetical protein
MAMCAQCCDQDCALPAHSHLQNVYAACRHVARSIARPPGETCAAEKRQLRACGDDKVKRKCSLHSGE